MVCHSLSWSLKRGTKDKEIPGTPHARRDRRRIQEPYQGLDSPGSSLFHHQKTAVPLFPHWPQTGFCGGFGGFTSSFF